jgi:hypothetical protein
VIVWRMHGEEQKRPWGIASKEGKPDNDRNSNSELIVNLYATVETTSWRFCEFNGSTKFLL